MLQARGDCIRKACNPKRLCVTEQRGVLMSQPAGLQTLSANRYVVRSPGKDSLAAVRLLWTVPTHAITRDKERKKCLLYAS